MARQKMSGSDTATLGFTFSQLRADGGPDVAVSEPDSGSSGVGCDGFAGTRAGSLTELVGMTVGARPHQWLPTKEPMASALCGRPYGLSIR
jgi:hypothetical protein